MTRRIALISSARVLLLGLVAYLPLITNACSSSAPNATTDAGTDAGGDAIDQAATAFIAELCDAYGACSCGSAPDCRATVEADARTRAFDGVRAETCLASIRAEAKRASFCLEPPATTACLAVFKDRAAKEPGSTCAHARECASGEDGDGLCLLQKCRRAKEGKEGDPCIGTLVSGALEVVFGLSADSGAICAAGDGLYCSEESKTCQRRGAVGAPCSGTDVSCVDDAWCPTTTSACVSRTADGAPCEDEYECAHGSRCRGDDSGTAACVPFEDAGGGCERGDECDEAKGLVCDGETAKCVTDASLATAACTGALALGD